jgi:molecular chaperone HtpG
VFGINLFGNPTLFVRELVANAIDATLDILGGAEPIRVRVEGNDLLTVRDYGSGMSEKTMEQVLPVFFKTTKAKENPRQIGVFGIGLYASLGYARQVVVRSRTRDAHSATMAIFGESGVTLQPIDWDGPGTEVSVHLSVEAPRSVTDKDELHKFLQSVFAFSPSGHLPEFDARGRSQLL